MKIKIITTLSGRQKLQLINHQWKTSLGYRNKNQTWSNFQLRHYKKFKEDMTVSCPGTITTEQHINNFKEKVFQPLSQTSN